MQKCYYGQKLYMDREPQVIPLDDADAPIIDWDNTDLNPPQVTPRKQSSNQLTATGFMKFKLSFFPIAPKSNARLKLLFSLHITF